MCVGPRSFHSSTKKRYSGRKQSFPSLATAPATPFICGPLLDQILQQQTNRKHPHILDKICNAARMDANNAALLTELGAVHAVLSQLKSHRHDFLIHSKMAYALDILFNWIMREVPEEEALSNSLHRLFREATSF